MRCRVEIEFSIANAVTKGVVEQAVCPPAIEAALHRRRAQCSENRQLGRGFRAHFRFTPCTGLDADVKTARRWHVRVNGDAPPSACRSSRGCKRGRVTAHAVRAWAECGLCNAGSVDLQEIKKKCT